MQNNDYWALIIVALGVFIWWSWPRHKKHHRRATKGILSMSKQLNIGGKSTATVSYTDSAGASVAVVGVPVWSSDNAAVTVTPAADGMTAEIDAVSIGTANITVTAEGDPEAGVDTISLEGVVNVVDEASGGTLSFS